MQLKLLTLLSFIIILCTWIVISESLVIAQSTRHQIDQTRSLFSQPHDKAILQEPHEINRPQMRLSNQQVITYPQYGPAEILLEDVGGSTTELTTAFTTNPDTVHNVFVSFSILQEGDTYYLWMSSWRKNNPENNRNSIEQRFESQDGLIWYNRTNTNLLMNSTAYKDIRGLREIIKDGDTYEGWEAYYYEWSSGWSESIRYVVSNDGITWNVVNQPALNGARYHTILKEGSGYRMWAAPDGDSLYTGTQSLRVRTSNSGGSNWGHWQTGGTLITLDGVGEVKGINRVRRLMNGSYEMFYRDNLQINVATSNDGINFTTQVLNLLDMKEVLALSDEGYPIDFEVVEVEAEDWFYFTYCAERFTPTSGCNISRIAVSRPLAPADLTLTKKANATSVAAGDTITYTLTYNNAGQTTATDVIITDIMPITLTNVAFVSSGPTITPSGGLTYQWQVEDLPAGSGGIITVTGQVSTTLTEGSYFTNTATITGTTVESSVENNIARAGVGVNVSDLTLTKSVWPETNVGSQESVTYTLVLANEGIVDAVDTLLTDTLPLSTTFAHWIVQPNAATVQDNQITWNGVVSANQAITFTFVVSHIGEYGETIVNQAEYSHPSRHSNAQASFTIENEPVKVAPKFVYLPLLIKDNSLLTAPDLIVEEVIATSKGITVTIKNIGTAPVVDAFWVDAYVDPSPAPSQVNQHWWELADQGAVWGVTTPIPVDGILILTIGDDNYSEFHSRLEATLPLGVPVYAQVDSVDLSSEDGSVLESHEIDDGPYNNIGQTTVTLTASHRTMHVLSNQSLSGSNRHLPPR